MQNNIAEIRPKHEILYITEHHDPESSSLSHHLDTLIPSPWTHRFRNAVTPDRFLSEMELALLLLKHPDLGLKKEDIQDIKSGRYVKDELSRATCEWVIKSHGKTNLEAWATMLVSRFGFASIMEDGQAEVLSPKDAIREILFSVEMSLTEFSTINADYGYLSNEDMLDSLLDTLDLFCEKEEPDNYPVFKTEQEQKEFEERLEADLFGPDYLANKARVALDSALNERDVAKRALERYEAGMNKEDPLPSWYMRYKRRLVAELARADLKVGDCREELQRHGGRLLGIADTRGGC